MNEISTVTIPLERYEALIRLEERVFWAVDKISRCNYISTEDLLLILGTEQAIERANELKKESERYRKEMSNEQRDQDSQ